MLEVRWPSLLTSAVGRQCSTADAIGLEESHQKRDGEKLKGNWGGMLLFICSFLCS